MKRREDVELPEKIQRILDRIVEEAQKLGRLEAVILFGSWATGRADADSDVDVLVVADVDDEIEAAARLRLALYGAGLPLDIVVYSSREWQWARDLPGFATWDASKRGILWHGRAA